MEESSSSFTFWSQNEAWVTFATNETQALGALVLGQSLRKVGTSRKLHILLTPGVKQRMREHLGQIFDAVTEVDVLDSKVEWEADEADLVFVQKPELGVLIAKLHCWLLMQYTKCVFLNAECLVIQKSDELFNYPELSAASDMDWPYFMFNSGVFVFEPSGETFTKLFQCCITEHRSFDNGDQSLFNIHFGNSLGPSHHLPFTFNMFANAINKYEDKFKRFEADIKIVHFTGTVKPWHHTYDFNTKALTRKSGDQTHLDFLHKWWTIFAEEIVPTLHHDYTVLLSNLANSDQELQDGERGMVKEDFPLLMETWINLDQYLS